MTHHRLEKDHLKGLVHRCLLMGLSLYSIQVSLEETKDKDNSSRRLHNRILKIHLDRLSSEDRSLKEIYRILSLDHMTRKLCLLTLSMILFLQTN